jgi:hypothetical protein
MKQFIIVIISCSLALQSFKRPVPPAMSTLQHARSGRYRDSTTLLQTLATAVCATPHQTYQPIAGTYRVNGPINFKGCSDARILLNGVRFFQTTAHTPIISISGGTDVTVEGGSFAGMDGDYNGLKNDKAGLINITNSSGIRIFHLSCNNFGYACVAFSAVSDLIIDGLTAVGPGAKYISANANYNFGVVGYGDGTGHSDIKIRNFDISAVATGINITDGWANVEVYGGTIHDIPGQHCVYAGAWINSSIHNFACVSPFNDGIKVNPGSGTIGPTNLWIHLKIVGSTDGASGTNFGVDLGSGHGRLNNVVISDNKITDFGSGINIRNGDEIQIVSNSLSNIFGVGIYTADVTALKIKNNSIMDTNWSPIVAGLKAGGHADILYNVISNPNRVVSRLNNVYNSVITLAGGVGTSYRVGFNSIAVGAGFPKWGIFQVYASTISCTGNELGRLPYGEGRGPAVCF